MTDREKLNQVLFDAYVRGLSFDDVAKKFGCCAETVRKAVRSIDPTRVRPPGRKPSSKYTETIRPEDWQELDSLTADTPVAATPAE